MTNTWKLKWLTWHLAGSTWHRRWSGVNWQTIITTCLQFEKNKKQSISNFNFQWHMLSMEILGNGQHFFSWSFPLTKSTKNVRNTENHVKKVREIQIQIFLHVLCFKINLLLKENILHIVFLSHVRHMVLQFLITIESKPLVLPYTILPWLVSCSVLFPNSFDLCAKTIFTS